MGFFSGILFIVLCFLFPANYVMAFIVTANLREEFKYSRSNLKKTEILKHIQTPLRKILFSLAVVVPYGMLLFWFITKTAPELLSRPKRYYRWITQCKDCGNSGCDCKKQERLLKAYKVELAVGQTYYINGNRAEIVDLNSISVFDHKGGDYDREYFELNAVRDV